MNEVLEKASRGTVENHLDRNIKFHVDVLQRALERHEKETQRLEVAIAEARALKKRVPASILQMRIDVFENVLLVEHEQALTKLREPA